jgi:hypothetical protein
MMYKPLFRPLLLAALCLSGVGCGRPFKAETAPGFVELDHQSVSTPYQYRATTPEGLTFAVRVIEDEERGDMGFWQQALTLQLRDVTGYALLEAVDTTSADGTKGKLLRFGHDEDNKPYLYQVAFYQAQGRLFLVEAGGTKALMDRQKAQIDWMMKSVKVKCDTLVSPVLASRTCNRW